MCSHTNVRPPGVEPGFGWVTLNRASRAPSGAATGRENSIGSLGWNPAQSNSVYAPFALADLSATPARPSPVRANSV